MICSAYERTKRGLKDEPIFDEEMFRVGDTPPKSFNRCRAQ